MNKWWYAWDTCPFCNEQAQILTDGEAVYAERCRACGWFVDFDEPPVDENGSHEREV